VRASVPLVRELSDTCSVEGCARGRTNAGMCRSHYNRRRTYGDPLAGGPIRTATGGGCISHGYWRIRVPEELSHLVPAGRRHEFEHRLVMSAALGRPLLPGETVHHVNGDRLDNRLDNLELWSTSQPKGQRVEDKLNWAREIVLLYAPELVDDHMKEGPPGG
jgi:hypothetical protein